MLTWEQVQNLTGSGSANEWIGSSGEFDPDIHGIHERELPRLIQDPIEVHMAGSVVLVQSLPSIFVVKKSQFV